MKSAYGKIVSSQVEPYESPRTSHGIITIQIPSKDYMKFNVDAYTNYDTLDEGKTVTVEYEEKPDTLELFAKRIVERND